MPTVLGVGGRGDMFIIDMYVPDLSNRIHELLLFDVLCVVGWSLLGTLFLHPYDPHHT